MGVKKKNIKIYKNKIKTKSKEKKQREWNTLLIGSDIANMIIGVLIYKSDHSNISILFM